MRVLHSIKRTLHLEVKLHELTLEFVLEFGKYSNGKLDIKEVTTKHDYKDYLIKIYSYNIEFLPFPVATISDPLINLFKGIVDKYLRGLIQEKLDGVGTQTLNIIRRALLECEEYYKLECLLIPF